MAFSRTGGGGRGTLGSSRTIASWRVSIAIDVYGDSHWSTSIVLRSSTADCSNKIDSMNDLFGHFSVFIGSWPHEVRSVETLSLLVIAIDEKSTLQRVDRHALET